MSENTFINMVNDNHNKSTTSDRHEAFLNKYKYTPATSKQTSKHYTGKTIERKKATSKSQNPKFKKAIGALFASGLIILGSTSPSKNSILRDTDTYIPVNESVMEQIESAIVLPKDTQLDSIFTFSQRNDLEEMKNFESNIIEYSKLKSEKKLTSIQKENLKQYEQNIKEYYNQNTSIINSTMLSFVKVAIADAYTNTHERTLANGISVQDRISSRDITFSDVTNNNYNAAKIENTSLNFKEAPEIYDAISSIVTLQNGNTDVRYIVDAYSKCAKVLDTNLSIEKNKSQYVISSQRDLKRDDYTR